MKNRKIIIIVAIVMLLILAGTLLFLSCRNGDKNTDDITRYEWIEMLCTQTGMEQGTLKTPVFDDVDETNEYYSYVQAAVNWGLLEEGDKFSGDKRASGRFIALTTMKAFGEKKIQIYLDTDTDISDKQYLQLALDLELISKEKMNRGFSEDEVRKVITRYQELYYGELWPDDYEEVSYQDSVTQLGAGDILWGDESGTEIIVSPSAAEKIQSGSVIVYDCGKGLKTARKVDNIDEEDRLTLSEDLQMEDVLQDYLVYATEVVSMEDIVAYYGLTEAEDVSAEEMWFRKGSSDEKPKDEEKTPGEFKLIVAAERNEETGEMELHVKIRGEKDNASVTYDLPNPIPIDEKAEWEMELGVEKINVKANADIQHGQLMGAEAHVDTNINASVGIKMGGEAEVKKKLMVIPVKLAGGICSVNVELYVVLSVDGKISIEAQFPVSGGACYERGKGVRYCKTDIHVTEPKIDAECDAELALRTEPVLNVIGLWNALDVELDIGAHYVYKATIHPTMTCIDKTFGFPVVTLEIGGDDDKKTLLQKVGISAEWEIVPIDHTLIRKSQHWEETPSEGKKKVPECTYSGTDAEGDKDVIQNADINMNPYTDKRLSKLFGKDIPAILFVQEIEERDNDYRIRGNVYVRDYMEKGRFDALKEGDKVTSLLGNVYVVTQIDQTLTDYPVIQFECNGEKWYCCKAKNYQFYEFPQGNITYLPISTNKEFARYFDYVTAHEEEMRYEEQGLDIPDEIMEVTEAGPYWAEDDSYLIENVEFTLDKDMPVYDAILNYSYSRKEVDDSIQDGSNMHMYEEGMTFGEAYAANEVQKEQYYTDRFQRMGFYLTQQGDLNLLFSVEFPD